MEAQTRDRSGQERSRGPRTRPRPCGTSSGGPGGAAAAAGSPPVHEGHGSNTCRRGLRGWDSGAGTPAASGGGGGRGRPLWNAAWAARGEAAQAALAPEERELAGTGSRNARPHPTGGEWAIATWVHRDRTEFHNRPGDDLTKKSEVQPTDLLTHTFFLRTADDHARQGN